MSSSGWLQPFPRGSDTCRVEWQTLNTAWPLLLPLAYLLLTCVLNTLSSHIRNKIEVHDRIRESKQKRLNYLADLAQRQDVDVAVKE